MFKYLYIKSQISHIFRERERERERERGTKHNILFNCLSLIEFNNLVKLIKFNLIKFYFQLFPNIYIYIYIYI